MLTKLGEAVGGWIPRRSGGDPLATIRAAWTTLVGVDIARAAAPVAITGDTLVVITSSSAWSHQLAFLEPRIVRGLGELDLSERIVRLRFRVGTIRVAVAGVLPRAAPAVALGASRPRSAPATAADALAAFRATVERSRARHQAGGGRFCGACGAPTHGAANCVPCRDWARAQREATCRRLLFDAPWLSPGDVLATVPGLDASAYDAIRRDVLRAWWDEMNLARRRAAVPHAPPPDRMRLRKIASSYVLLETKIDPKSLEMDSPVRRNALGELYDFIRGVEAEVHSPSAR